MRKVTFVTVLVLVMVGLGLYGVVMRPFSSDLNVVRKLSVAFLEDLQFKDFRSSALYHHVFDRARIDIGRALEELFLAKPELVDIMDFRISRAELDSTGDRAKVVMNTRFKLLNKKEGPREADIILYWIKRHPDCPLGASCVASTCRDESGRVVYKPASGLDEEQERRNRDPRQRVGPSPDAVRDSTGDEPYECDPLLPPRWFMNLDSTLKQKDYR